MESDIMSSISEMELYTSQGTTAAKNGSSVNSEEQKRTRNLISIDERKIK
ncbi:MAG: hypothetical protein ACTTKJ_04325 [Prevotella koreensis]